MKDYVDLREFSDENPPKKIKGDHDPDQDAAAVNPLYDESKAYTVTNCVQCTTTYDLRRRGYDVTAKMCDTGTYVDKVVSDLYKGKAETLKPVFANSWGDVEKSVLKKFPEGSRGLFSINSPMLGMGHSMAFEVKDNKLKIIDAQCANADVNIKSKKYKSFAPAYTLIKRLDNLEVNMKSVSHYSAELKDNWKKSVPKQKSERKMSESNVVSKYRKEHPNSKLSDKEIIENYTE